MQNIMLIGHLTADASVKSVIRNGVKSEFVAFTIGVNEVRGDERSSTFYDITMNKSNLVEYLKKGTKVFILGRFRFLMTNDPKTGKVYPHLNVSVLDIQLLDSKKQDNPGEEDIPAE